MPQYVQQVGGTPVDFSTLSQFKNLQEASDQGWLPVAAPASPTPAETPTTPINETGQGTLYSDTTDFRSQLNNDYNTYVNDISNYQSTLGTLREQTIKDIEASSAEQSDKETKRYGTEMGSKTMFLAGTQAFGRTMSGQESLNAVERSHLTELRVIDAQKQRLIREAQAAFAEKDFAAVKEKISLLKNARTQEMDTYMKLENLKLQKAAAERAQGNYELDIQTKQNKLMQDNSNVIAAGLVDEKGNATLTDEEIYDLAIKNKINPYYLANAVNNRIDTIKKLMQANWKEYYNIAKDMAVGDSITAPDGTIINGLDKTKDMLTYDVEKNGLKYKVAVNKVTGKVIWQNETGIVKKTGGSGGGGGGKTITWQMAKDLGDLSLYGKPVSEVYKNVEDLSYDEWLMQMHAKDPTNYPLISSSALMAEYEQFKSQARNQIDAKLGEDQGDGGNEDAYALEIIQANQGQGTPEEMIQFLLESIPGLTYSKAKTLVKDNYDDGGGSDSGTNYGDQYNNDPNAD